MKRREFIGCVLKAGVIAATLPAQGAEKGIARKRLGIGMHSYGAHWAVARTNPVQVRFSDALQFLEYGHDIGAGGVQVAIGACGPDKAKQLRERVETLQAYIEGQTSLPRSPEDVGRFDDEVRDAKAAGATVIRSALLGGRRYETFDSADAFRQFASRSWKSLTLAEPVLRKHGVRLAVENHKDWLVPELLEFLNRLSSEYVGVCIDTGNSIALLEDPIAVVEAYAPWVLSTHLKDMGVQEFEQGFLLSEVPLGDGFLDLKRIIEICLHANPNVQFNLEMITRDPLRVPCLTDRYWTTFDKMPAAQLAKALALVRKHSTTKPLPQTSQLNREQKLKAEDDNVRLSIAFARKELGL